MYGRFGYSRFVIPILSVLMISSLVLAQGNSLKNFPLNNVDGTTNKLSHYLEKGPVYVNFWAMWCEPCKLELRSMKPIADKLSGSFTLLAVNQDSPKSLAKVKAYVRSQGYSFPVILDPNNQLFQSLNGQNLPFSVLIDKSGKVVSTRTGYLAGDEKEIEKEIMTLLNKE